MANQSKSDTKTLLKAKRVEEFLALNPTIWFKGQLLVRTADGWRQMTRLAFDRASYATFGALRNTDMNEIYNMVVATAPERSDLDRFLAFGDGRVWDRETHSFTTDTASEDCIFFSPYSPSPSNKHLAEAFLLDLANGVSEVRADIAQSMAPMLLDVKPDGVIWWQGGGSNGKSSLMDALEALFPDDQLAHMTLKQLEGESDAPQLNGKFANIVDESSEGLIEDSRTYKSIGSHKNFHVHKFHSQDMIEIDGSLHHILSTNNMPVFSDKTDGARRRTLVIQFRNKFKDDPMFKKRTFTPEFFSGLLQVIVDEAVAMAKRGHTYRWSDHTLQVKADYDKIANTAESFAEWAVKELGLVYFTNFTKMRFAYEWWCNNNGYSPLGRGNFRAAIMEYGFKRSSKRDADGKNQQIFLLEGCSTEDTREVMPGLFSNDGTVAAIKEPEQTDLGVGGW